MRNQRYKAQGKGIYGTRSSGETGGLKPKRVRQDRRGIERELQRGSGEEEARRKRDHQRGEKESKGIQIKSEVIIYAHNIIVHRNPFHNRVKVQVPF